jgi:hypothetical protein
MPGDQNVDLGASANPLPDVGNSSLGSHLVSLPGRRFLSDQAGLSERGDGG